MRAPYVDDATIGKFIACLAHTLEGPYRVYRGKPRCCDLENHSRIARMESCWANLFYPERVVHDRWIGCSEYVGPSASEIILEIDPEQVPGPYMTVALGHFIGVRIGGGGGVVVVWSYEPIIELFLEEALVLTGYTQDHIE